MTSVSAGHVILTPTQPVGSGRPQRGSNPGPPLQESSSAKFESIWIDIGNDFILAIKKKNIIFIIGFVLLSAADI